jgi:HSP20 family molecular chaperone IbpA
MFDTLSFFDSTYFVEEADGNTLIHIPLPGATKEDIEIDAEPARLEVRVKADKKLPFLKQRRWRFTHRFGSPEVSAKVTNGVLEIRMSEVGRSRYRVEVA